MLPSYQGLPLEILEATPQQLCVHLNTQRPLRALELPEITYAGRQWVPFTTRLWSPQTAAFHGRRAGYEIEYRPVRERASNAAGV